MKVGLVVAIACIVVGCGPLHTTDSGPDIDAGTCDAPAAGAIVGIANLAAESPTVSLNLNGSAVDCDTDLQCSRHHDFEVPQGLEENLQVQESELEHTFRACTCEMVGPGTYDGHCDEDQVAGTTVWIQTVADDCVTGAIQRAEDEEPTAFVATVCCRGPLC